MTSRLGIGLRVAALPRSGLAGAGSGKLLVFAQTGIKQRALQLLQLLLQQALPNLSDRVLR